MLSREASEEGEVSQRYQKALGEMGKVRLGVCRCLMEFTHNDAFFHKAFALPIRLRLQPQQQEEKTLMCAQTSLSSDSSSTNSLSEYKSCTKTELMFQESAVNECSLVEHTSLNFYDTNTKSYNTNSAVDKH